MLLLPVAPSSGATGSFPQSREIGEFHWCSNLVLLVRYLGPWRHMSEQGVRSNVLLADPLLETVGLFVRR